MVRARMLLLALGFFACSTTSPGGTNPPPPPGPPPPPPNPPPPAPVVSVEVRNNVFVPEVASVMQGGTVTWTWVGSNHTVTSVLAPAFNANTGVQNSGFQLGPLIFNTPGTFDYICTVHGSVQGTTTSGMLGQVLVQ